MNRKVKALALALSLGLGLLLTAPASAGRSAKPRRPGIRLRIVWEAAVTAWWGAVSQVKDTLAIDPNGATLPAASPAAGSAPGGTPPATEGGLAIDPNG